MNVALWGFHSFARLEELHWSKDGRDGPQTLPGPVKMSSSPSLPSSHVLRLSRWPVPNTGHPSSRCLNMLCILLQALTDQRTTLLRYDGSGPGEWWTIHEVHSAPGAGAEPSWEDRPPSSGSSQSRSLSGRSWIRAKRLFLYPHRRW